ncbi:MAG: AAA family ATPase [Opitutaceae bacterium]|jgi:energy-coupling factor transporter ATP-binding protein EcfA2
MAWCSNVAYPDIKNLVLIFAHIGRCRHIENLSLRWDGQINCTFKREGSGLPTLEISANPAFIDLFEKQKVKINVICGINGVGKTTILRLLSGRLPHDRAEDDLLIVFRDPQGNFVANNSLIVKTGSEEPVTVDQALLWGDLSLSTLCANRVLNPEEEQFGIGRSIAQHYVEHRSLYDDARDPLFSHVSVDFWGLDETADSIADHLNENLGWKLAGFEITRLLRQHPVFFALLAASRDNTFDPLFSRLRQTAKPKDLPALHALMDGLDPGNKLESRIQGLLGHPQLFDKAKTSQEQLAELIREQDDPKPYPIEDYSTVREQLGQLSKEVFEAIARYADELKQRFSVRYLHIGDRLEDLLVIRPFKETPTGRRYLGNLSSGEYMDIWARWVLQPTMMQSDACWLHLDEPDLHLHPEWKRQFLSRFIDAIQSTREYLSKASEDYRDKVYTIILTTHSPFILSDVTSDHAILLDLGKNRQPFLRQSSTGTFAGNIGAMFYDQFFMTETIGAYAEKIIAAAIERIDTPRKLEVGEREHFIKLFSTVGDSLLRKLLIAKLEAKLHAPN